MLFASSLLFIAPIALCAPLQQWSVNNNNNNINNSPQGTNPDQMLTMNVMIHDDIQSHYENMVDEVISTHSEDILFRLAHAMIDQDSLDDLLQPQATALLNHPAQGTCLNRMPSMIAKQLHDLHAKALAIIEPTLNSFPLTQDTDTMQHLTQLNMIMDQKMMAALKHHPLEHNVALALSACERQLAPPKRSLWLLLKPFWKANASQMTQPANSVPETTFLQSHLEAVGESLHLEFKLRLVDLFRTVQTDRYDDEMAPLL